MILAESNLKLAELEAEQLTGATANLIYRANITEKTRDIDGVAQTFYTFDEYRTVAAFDEGMELTEAWAGYIVARDKERTAARVRAERDELLAASDKYILSDIPTETTKTVWKEYRQSLRDIPENDGFPYNVVFPTKPKR